MSVLLRKAHGFEGFSLRLEELDSRCLPAPRDGERERLLALVEGTDLAQIGTKRRLGAD